MSAGVIDEVVARLDALLEATPPPPPFETEPDDVIEAFTTVSRERARLIAELAVLAPAGCRDPRVLERHAVLVARDQAWMGALQRAQIIVGDRMTAVRRARAYSR